MLARRVLIRITPVFLLGALVVGCASTDERKAPALAPIERANFCERYAEALCARVQTCCTRAGITPNALACATNVREGCRRAAEAAETKGAMYDGATAAACIGAVKKWTDSCDRPREFEYSRDLEVCDRIWVGTVAVGGDCYRAYDCAQSSSPPVFCRRFGTGASCVVQRIGAVGESCAETSKEFVECADGLFCDWKLTCAPRGSRGAACAPDYAYSCAPGLTCSRESKVCVDPPSTGSPCNWGSPSACVSGAWCQLVAVDPPAAECGAAKAAGESCEFPGTMCASRNCYAGTCTANFIASPDRCGGGAFVPDDSRLLPR